MNSETTSGFPRSLKIIAILLLCVFCFTVGRFASVWNERLSEKTQMELIIADSAKFERAMNDVLVTLRYDVNSFLEKSGKIVVRTEEFKPDTYGGNIHRNLMADSLIEESRRPFKSSFSETYNLSHLQNQSSQYLLLGIDPFQIVYDRTLVEELSNESTTEDPLEKSPVQNVYAGKGFYFSDILPDFVTAEQISPHFSATQLDSWFKKVGTVSSYTSSWFFKSKSVVHPEGAYLKFEVENDTDKNTITITVTFSEFSLRTEQ
ncbi:hypothetical protein Pla110_10310 [Polystyrenella longa]|uniref:Uncharacterized protein n=1 Tax=Polystyrenella longa TaxID=2528007 RepID=A0A518CJC1_9PLAN|nr:hypothetical protein [Polystyrenella longa]QDU79323.1 hypothetical protein Pla110_10310 [Polystyrenella longa]